MLELYVFLMIYFGMYFLERWDEYVLIDIVWIFNNLFNIFINKCIVFIGRIWYFEILF